MKRDGIVFWLQCDMYILCCAVFFSFVSTPSFQLKAGVSGMKIGLIKETLTRSISEVAAVVRKAAGTLQEAGALVEEVSLENIDTGKAVDNSVTYIDIVETLIALHCLLMTVSKQQKLLC